MIRESVLAKHQSEEDNQLLEIPVHSLNVSWLQLGYGYGESPEDLCQCRCSATR